MASPNGFRDEYIRCHSSSFFLPLIADRADQ